MIHFPRLSVHADLVLSVLGEVLDPGGGLVAGAVDDLEVAHLEAGDGEEGDFEVDVDGLLLVEVALGRLDGRQLEVCAQDVLPASAEAYLWPANCFTVHFRALCSGT